MLISHLDIDTYYALFMHLLSITAALRDVLSDKHDKKRTGRQEVMVLVWNWIVTDETSWMYERSVLKDEGKDMVWEGGRGIRGR